MDQPRLKRALSPSSSSSAASSSSKASNSATPPPKFHRSSPSSLPFTCTFPPTCNQPSTSTSFSTLSELESHQEKYHRYICTAPIRDKDVRVTRSGKGKDKEEEDGHRLPDGFVSGTGRGRWKECGKVFPDERFLELHHTEVHDPLERQRLANGDKIFECFLPKPECGKRFLTPASRRKHLIAKHKYPKEFFFSITNHGLNLITEEEGFAASLIRPRKDFQIRSIPTENSTLDQIPQSDRQPQSDPISVKSEAIERIHDDPQELLKEDQRQRDQGMDVDELANKMESSLAFLPKAVRKKQTSKA